MAYRGKGKGKGQGKGKGKYKGRSKARQGINASPTPHLELCETIMFKSVVSKYF